MRDDNNTASTVVFFSTCFLFAGFMVGCMWCSCRWIARSQVVSTSDTTRPTEAPEVVEVEVPEKSRRVFVVVNQPSGEYALASRTMREKNMCVRQ